MSSCSQEKWSATTAAAAGLVLSLTGFAREKQQAEGPRPNPANARRC